MKKYFNSPVLITFILVLIISLALLLRFNSLNWDQNQHLHPDERFLTMVTNDVSLPSNLNTYLNPDVSPLNPYNAGYTFYVYGTLPLTLTKIVSQYITFDNFTYNNITLVGRLLSALVDVLTVLIIFKIGQKIFGDKAGLIASFIYATSVLPIQLSHFYAVDTFLVFFATLAFFFMVNYVYTKTSVSIILAGTAFGLSIASKISALTFLPFLVAPIIFTALKRNKYLYPLLHLMLFIGVTYLVLRLVDPRIFTNDYTSFRINDVFIENIKQLESYNKPDIHFPPAVQWIKTKSFTYPAGNMFFWGWGVPLFVTIFMSIVFTSIKIFGYVFQNISKPTLLVRNMDYSYFFLVVIMSWIMFLFIYQGQQFAKALRYFYPMYPFSALIAGNFITVLLNKLPVSLKLSTTISFLILLLLWPMSFSAIYSKNHTRISASKWIYENVPQGSVITCEYWDDCLPLTLGDNNIHNYTTQTLSLFEEDTEEKWNRITKELETVDYLVLSSNRLWGSITKVPELYPVTSKFYNDLFTNKLHFIKVAEFTSFPTLPVVNIIINDTSSDETFTVYDHPVVMIFKRI
ncbi:glycosyltransferase family 39 protein [Candidatus Woesebacteria bacterium]|nr:MAG: glycosyltransferase family 39 protein [Candidatus Woesebacteria bacterium]